MCCPNKFTAAAPPKLVGFPAPLVTPPHFAPPTPSRKPLRATGLLSSKSGTYTNPTSDKKTVLSAPRPNVIGCDAVNAVVVPTVPDQTSYSK